MGVLFFGGGGIPEKGSANILGEFWDPSKRFRGSKNDHQEHFSSCFCISGGVLKIFMETRCNHTSAVDCCCSTLCCYWSSRANFKADMEEFAEAVAAAIAVRVAVFQNVQELLQAGTISFDNDKAPQDGREAVLRISLDCRVLTSSQNKPEMPRRGRSTS